MSINEVLAQGGESGGKYVNVIFQDVTNIYEVFVKSMAEKLNE